MVDNSQGLIFGQWASSTQPWWTDGDVITDDDVTTNDDVTDDVPCENNYTMTSSEEFQGMTYERWINYLTWLPSLQSSQPWQDGTHSF